MAATLGGGITVATTADLNTALSAQDAKMDKQREWCEGQIADFIMKLRAHTDRIDHNEREQQAAIESMSSDLKSLRAGTVTNVSFRQQMGIFEKAVDHEKTETESKMEQLKLAMEKEIANSIGNLRLKAETLNANCITLTEKSRVLEETLIPAIRSDVEEQKQKRLCETQRLESENEKMKELMEQKLGHTAAALRFYVTATATKLREELAQVTTLKEMEEDFKQRDAEAKKQLLSVQETLASFREELGKHKSNLDAETQNFTRDIGSHAKGIKVVEITLTNLQNSIVADLNDMREQLRTDRVNLQTEVADARAAAARSASQNEQAITSVASEINPLRQFRELIQERLHIEKIVSTVRDWQTGYIPQLLSTTKDVEERLRKVTANVARDHDAVAELQKATTSIRSHFKMFHAIASGLDDKPMPVGGVEDTRLPPISARGQRTPDGGA